MAENYPINQEIRTKRKLKSRDVQTNNKPEKSSIEASHISDANASQEKLLSLHEASKMTGYHQDYLGQVARAGKLEAKKVGRNWFTTKLAIDKFLGRVPASVMPQPVPEPVEEIPVVVQAEKIMEEPVYEPVAEPEPSLAPVMQMMEQVAEEIFVPTHDITPQPVPANANRNFDIKVQVNILSVSPEAGPNLQEAIAIPQPEVKELPVNLDSENRNKLFHLNKLTSRSEGENSHSTHIHTKEKIIVRSRPSYFSFPAFALGVIALVLGAGIFFPDLFFTSEQPPSQQIAGASTSSSGKQRIPAGQTETAVQNDSVDSNSVIMISFRDDFAGRYWVSQQKDGSFTLRLSNPSDVALDFDYWIAPGDRQEEPVTETKGLRE
jgi:hypothetical protein